MPSRARAIVDEALVLRESHSHAPAAEVLDVAMRGRGAWLEDFFEHGRRSRGPPKPALLAVASEGSADTVITEARGCL